jgi:undecaprenyl-diphosphatase
VTAAIRTQSRAAYARFARNGSLLADRLRRVRRESFAFDRQRAAVSAGIALAAVVLVGIALDPLVAGLPERLPAWLHAFFQWSTRFGKSDWLLIPSAVLVIVFGFGDWRRVGRVVATGWNEIASFAVVVFASVAVSGLTTDVLKALVGRSRPAFTGDATFVFHPFTLGGYAHYSFPSGHATTMAAVAVIVTATFSGRWRAILLAAAALVAVTRVMLGVHYPSDVVGGLLIGGSIAWLIVRLAAEARIGFAERADGSIAPRFGALRGLRRRRALAGLFPGLWRSLARGG